MAADIVIKGGTVIDGTGGPPGVADVAVSDGRIADIGTDLAGDRVLDAQGRMVTPGFIDIHTHYDAQVFWDPHLTPSCHHGVTTVVAGNCGFSIAPIHREQVELLASTLHHVEDMSIETLAAGVPWGEFETFAEYLDAVSRRGVALNYGCYIGHTALRLWAMGDDAYEREPTEAERSKMVDQVEQALAAGAMGFATSHSPTHNGEGGRPVPSRRASMEEVLALAAPLREADRGVVALLPGDGMTHDEAFDVWEAIRRPVTWTALLTIKGFPWHEDIIATLDERRRDGAQVWPQVSGRPLVFQMNLADPFSLNLYDSFRALMDAPAAKRLAAYSDPAWRRRAWDECNRPAALPVNWGALSVAESDRHPELIGLPRRRSGGAAVGHRRRDHPTGRDAGPLTGRRSGDTVQLGARQQRPRRDRVAPAARRRAPGPRGLRGARESALRRVLLDRPPRALGPRRGCDADRTCGAQAHR